MSISLRRRDLLAAAIGLLSPGYVLAQPDLKGPDEIERILADEFWVRFQRREPQGNGELYVPVDDATFNRAMNDIAAPLLGMSTRSALDWRIGTADVNTINAFTPGGGVVCMLRGLVRFCDTETQLASVIAHEAGHVEHRHRIKSIMASSLFAEIDHDLLSKNSPEFRQSFVLNQYEAVAPELIYIAHSRLREHEADAFSVRALAAVGYDMRQSHSLFEKLLATEPGKVPFNSCLVSTHPLTEERIARIKGLSRRYGKQRPRPDSDAFRYLKSVA